MIYHKHFKEVEIWHFIQYMQWEYRPIALT
jgi:hypothetical protein